MRPLVVAILGVIACGVGCTFLFADPETPPTPRDAMRAFVVAIANSSRLADPNFIVVAQNGDELLTTGTSAADPLANDYVAAIDGLGREDLLYGYAADNEPTPIEATNWMLSYLDRAEAVGIEVLTTDYCWDAARMDDAYARNAERGFASFAAPRRDLDLIPTYPEDPVGMTADDILDLSDVANFIYLINPRQFDTKASFLSALAGTNYDALILDLEFEGRPLAAADIELLKVKTNGGSRLVLCYLSIGEAEDYRNYWDASWTANPPGWLLEENPNWPGNYPVRYWDGQWQAIVFSMLDVILDAGFDGVYLDRVDVYEMFEI